MPIGKASEKEGTGQCYCVQLKVSRVLNSWQTLADPVFGLINEEDDHDEIEKLDDYLEDMRARGRYASLTGVINDYVRSVQNELEEKQEQVHAVDDPEPRVMHLKEAEKIIRLETQQNKENQNEVKGIVMMARRNAPSRQSGMGSLQWRRPILEGSQSTGGQGRTIWSSNRLGFQQSKLNWIVRGMRNLMKSSCHPGAHCGVRCRTSTFIPKKMLKSCRSYEKEIMRPI